MIKHHNSWKIHKDAGSWMQGRLWKVENLQKSQRLERCDMILLLRKSVVGHISHLQYIKHARLPPALPHILVEHHLCPASFSSTKADYRCSTVLALWGFPVSCVTIPGSPTYVLHQVETRRQPLPSQTLYPSLRDRLNLAKNSNFLIMLLIVFS